MGDGQNHDVVNINPIHGGEDILANSVSRVHSHVIPDF